MTKQRLIQAHGLAQLVCFVARAILLKLNPIISGQLTIALTLASIGVFPYTASAQTTGNGQDATAADASNSGRAPSFPISTDGQYFPAAPNDLGITGIKVNYPDQPGTLPEIILVDRVGGIKPTGYIGYDNDGIWVYSDFVPKWQGKPFTVKLVDGKAVIQGRDKYPRGLSNPSSAYADMLASQDKQSGPNTTASNPPVTGQPAGPTQRRGVGRGTDNLGDRQPNAALGGIGPAATTAQVQPVTGTGAKVAGGILTFTDAKGDTQSFKVERLSQGTPNPAAPNMGAFLYTAPDGKSGMLFTLMGTPDGRISGRWLNELALGMLKPK